VVFYITTANTPATAQRSTAANEPALEEVKPKLMGDAAPVLGLAPPDPEAEAVMDAGWDEAEAVGTPVVVVGSTPGVVAAPGVADTVGLVKVPAMEKGLLVE